jgi:hypothetical protein
MRTLDDIGRFLDAPSGDAPALRVAALLQAGEEILENWLCAHDLTPDARTREGFRLLALQFQGAKADPSFNACRETCRELVYHYNVIAADPNGESVEQTLRMMSFVLTHLYLFIRGKLDEAGLGEFCCSSRPLRSQAV